MKPRKLNFPSPNWAVFNQHVRNAKKRATAMVRARFGPDGAKEISRANREGIMSIFQKAPTPVTELYAFACFLFVNGMVAE